jgi:simple sugar transport system ATP-binding protein
VTVLRKGELVGTAEVSSVTAEQLANMMVGREVTKQPLQRAATQATDTVLHIDGISVQDDTGLPAINNLSLDIKSGEIVGIAGVSGNGQKELVQALAGQRQISSGRLKVHGEPYQAKRQQMRAHKFHCLPEEPLRNACVPAMSIADNLAFRRFDRPPLAIKNWILNRAAIKSAAKELISRFSIRTWGPENPVGNLSGGNVQRTVLARELSEEVNALVVVNPCFGLDFNAVADIREQIMQARNRGTAVLLVSEDLDEILELSDRFLVISEGKLVFETTPQNADLTVVGQHMAGH